MIHVNESNECHVLKKTKKRVKINGLHESNAGTKIRVMFKKIMRQ